MRAHLRRYPALGFLAVAALLASLLPSALRVPLSGPSASAELAPVPGKSDAAPGDLSALGQPSSGGLGGETALGALGRGGRGGLDAMPGNETTPPPDNGRGRNPSNKRCVGKPPRQTEDPLSPPCVAFFDGDNGGATAKGVTRDEIRLAFYSGCSNGGPEQLTAVDENGSDPQAALLRFFNTRYQAYGRRVRAWTFTTPACVNARPEEKRAAFDRLNQQVDPFVVVVVQAGDEALTQRAAEAGVWVNAGGAERRLFRANAPYLHNFLPDLEGYVEHIAEMLCAKLAGRPARYSGNPLDTTRTRRFGVLYGNVRTGKRDALLVADEVRRRCGDRAGEVSVPATVALGNEATNVARWIEEGVTTVVNLFGGSEPYHAAAADAAGWHPEWLWVPGSTTNVGFRAFYSPAQMAHSFGLTADPRQPERKEEAHSYRAFREACPGCPEPPANMNGRYQQLLLVFTGIQAAGPRLTVANIDRGLRAIPPHQSTDPFSPSAYYAPDDYTFVKDATVIRWDPKGQTADGVGCWRYVEHGKRYRAEDWRTHPVDDDFDTAGWPCHGWP